MQKSCFSRIKNNFEKFGSCPSHLFCLALPQDLQAHIRRLTLQRATKGEAAGGTQGSPWRPEVIEARGGGPPSAGAAPGRPELKGSIGEGPNHSNFSHQSSVKILSKFNTIR